MNFDGYTRGETTVRISRQLSRQEFDEVALLLQQNLGRHKASADEYVLTCKMGHILNTVLSYLRRINAPHQMEMIVIWDGHQ